MPQRRPKFLGFDTAGGKFTRRAVLKFGTALPLMMLGASFSLKALAAAPLSSGDAPLPAKKPRAPRLLMLDPGHGGHDPGATGLNGVLEKDVTLDIAKNMAKSLFGKPDINVKLTRDCDIFLPLQERVKIARDAGADLFISIHADSAPSKAARGLSCYTLSEKASDALAGAIAEKENLADMVGGVDLSQADQEVAAILFDLSARRTRNTSQRVKVSFVRAMSKKWQMLESPMRSANFAVLRSPDVPSILVETGFLSNPKDEALLRQPKQREKIAQLMAKELSWIVNSPLFG